MDATKNRGRGKIFKCFKPVVDDDHEPDRDSASLPSSGDESGERRKKRLRRSFSAALKAVLFKTSLLKKSRSENAKQDWDGLRSNLLFKGKKLVKSMKKNSSSKAFLDSEEVFRTNSSRSTLFSSNSSNRTPSVASSSSTSSCSSHSRSGSDKINRSVSLDFRQMSSVHKQTVMRRECSRKYTYNLTLEMCVFLVCLVALAWGKVFAIVTCTSAWLFLAPGSRGSHQLRRFASFDDVIESEEDKKRVIMDGLLERNRSRVLQL